MRTCSAIAEEPSESMGKLTSTWMARFCVGGWKEAYGDRVEHVGRRTLETA